MAESAQITMIKPFHEQLINALLANPSVTNSQLAMMFNRTSTHISIIKNSDAFKAVLRERQDQLFGEVVVQETKDRLEALAQVSLERLIEKTQISENEDFILSAATMATKALGFGQPKSSGPAQVQANFYVASPQELAAGRAVIEGKSE